MEGNFVKNVKRVLILSLSVILILSLVLGCSAKSSKNEDTAVSEESRSGSLNEPMVTEDMDFSDSPLEPEKIITTIYLRFETTEFEGSTTELEKIVKKYKAYVESSDISYNQHYNNKSYRYGSFVVRVPKDSVANFKSELNGIGNIISENINKEDVTKNYRDMESRLKVITTKEERVLALLAKAEKIEDIIALENQLGETIAEKESLKASLMDIDNKVDFNTINIEIQEVEKLSNTETIETSFGTRVANAFSNSLYGFKNSMENLVISLIYLLPFIIVLGIVIYLVYMLTKRFAKRKDK